MSSFVHHFKSIGEVKLELQPGNTQVGYKLVIFLSCVTLKIDVWTWKTIEHLSYAASTFVHHFIANGEFKLELQSGNAQLGSKSTIFFSHVTLKIDVWPWKTIGHLFYTMSSFVHHFKSIGEVKLELQPGNTQVGYKLVIFLSCVTLKIDVWTWKTIEHLSYAASTFVHHFIANGEFKLELQSGNAQLGSKSTIFFSHVTLKFDGWPWRTIGYLL